MKKLYSLIKASMTSDMHLFKFKRNKNSKFSKILPAFIALYLMFMIWGSANAMFEPLGKLGLAYVLLSLFIFSISLMTMIEGIYKTGSLIFNCKDDDLLLSLPIKKSTVIFIRMLKFYIFELLFNSLFLLPIMIAYIRWDSNITWTYYLTSIIMLLLSPVIPIAISSIIGAITSSVVSRFKYKNAAEIIISMTLILGILYVSYNMDGIVNYIMAHAKDINDFITKIYYPAGVYGKLVTNFKVGDLLLFILINILVLGATIFALSKVYFKINSRLKKVTTTKKTKISELQIRANSKYKSLILKEFNTFFKTPVFIINAGFALILFLLASFIVIVNYQSISDMLVSENGLNLSTSLVNENKALLVFLLISAAGYMTSITSSVVSLEGKNITILKSLPISTKTILMSKVYSSLLITTPVLLIGDIILAIKLKISLIETILLIILSVLIPLVSHFIGIIVNLKYPKLDFENTTEVVKQSMSSFIAVIIGMALMVTSYIVITKVLGLISSTLILVIAIVVYIIINTVLYIYLINKGVKEFNSLTV